MSFRCCAKFPGRNIRQTRSRTIIRFRYTRGSLFLCNRFRESRLLADSAHWGRVSRNLLSGSNLPSVHGAVICRRRGCFCIPEQNVSPRKPPRPNRKGASFCPPEKPERRYVLGRTHSKSKDTVRPKIGYVFHLGAAGEHSTAVDG